MHLVWPEMFSFGLYIIWTVISLLHVPLVIIRVACTVPYLRSTIIWPVISLSHVSSGITPVACTSLYIRSNIIWYILPVLMEILWNVIGHIFVSNLYLPTRVSLTS